MLRLRLCRSAWLTWVLALATSAAPGSELKNEHWLAIPTDQGLGELRCDPGGGARFGAPLLRPPGIALDGANDIRASVAGRELRLDFSPSSRAASTRLTWTVPFVREGFYDADSHRLYGSADSLEFRPHREVYRKFVGGSGHARFLEEFKRVEPTRPSSYGASTVIAPIVLGPSNRLLLCGDPEGGFDLDVHWPGAERLECLVADDRLTFRGPITGRLTVRVEPSGRTMIPGDPFRYLTMKFLPDRTLTQSITGKSASLNALVADYLQQGLHFYPGVITGGDWLNGAITTHQLDDPRSPAVRDIRRALVEAANFGYDRCGHFGLMYGWGDSPNYGDGGFLAPSIDARHLHINWVFISSFARSALMTRDRSLLRAVRRRWLALDDGPPILGEKANVPDPVLIKGDWRLDFGLPTQHRLGQTFTARSRFGKVRLALGNRADSAAKVEVRVRRDGPAGAELAVLHAGIPPRTPRAEIEVSLREPASPGRYHAELADVESGRKWDGGLCWWTDPDAPATDPADAAWNGPFQGDRWQMLRLLFDYGYRWFGPEHEGVAAFLPRSGCGLNRSGRTGDPIACVSYWEQYGGGKDLWSSLWYPTACHAMAELARFQGLNAEAVRYDELHRLANESFRRTFGREIDENGSRRFRYVACVDWDDDDHDYGHAHYNLEAIERGIADEGSARRILDWLDHGAISRDGGRTWGPGIYDFWQIAPPFLTVNNTDWQGLGGQTGGYPFGSVLAAGGTRLGTVYPDLISRARIQGADAAWTRTLQVLDRYARPDRLTGGRIVLDPGGRGRWHFGPPSLDRADIEGFREIFPDNGAAAVALPVAFLGLEPTAEGLRLSPRVPSSLDGFEVDGLGYGGAVWKLAVAALRRADGDPQLGVTLSSSHGPTDGWQVEVGKSRTPIRHGQGAVVVVPAGGRLTLIPGAG
ncbi:hypothetical protein [Aquisphaera insulae]|uniref:hypothetical protein n=1 Tax=Aquisphaera insulae TaxID=2712864 RepID=UPI0013ED63C1|nr:hypothetical protein [Aquisphaera insulae]